MNREMTQIIRSQTPVTMPGTATVREACKQMHGRRIGAVMVTDDDGKLQGIFTGRDVVRIVANGGRGGESLLRDVMTRGPATMGPHSTAIEALRLMWDGGFRHVPIVDQDRVVGIVSRGDFRGLEHDRLDVETGFWERIG